MKVKFKDSLVIGFALFAMFFGAGNLIFPPLLGVVSGTKWFTSFAAFLFADGGLALLGVIALTRTDGDMEALFTRAGRFIGVLIGSLMILCIGPFLAIPRTAATTYEIGIKPTIGTGLSPIIFAIIFFAIVLVLTIKPSKVVDIVGAFLTPALLICLAVLIIKGVVSPLGQPLERTLVDNLAVNGINEGYQTMDAMASCIFAGIVISSIRQKGYTERKVMVKATIVAGIVAVIGMAFVYGGLTYLGATVSPIYDNTVERTALIVSITEGILGGTGKVILAIIVALACLTTAIGLSSSCGNYFSQLTKGKLKYEVIVVVVCVFSAVVSNFGVDKIIAIAAPILGMIYPAVVAFIFLGMINDKIKNNNVFKCAIWVAVILGVLHTLPGIKAFANVTALANFAATLDKLPGGNIGFFWAIPVLIAGIIGRFIPSKNA
ncbi:MAG: branched-chain amino acid transport system II carrier protein [Peptostreptococcus porci]|uniref:Branched-chain amino acid transport system carrier protein n=1 Tax=Peptostreptococcus porci TaxID=2652282 RepID=A0A6N7XFE8_9FIRM|nr:branched-chain amino acid transport system II carrier protein [Peptostreptococcus porci]MDY2793931.1 branched-chain amino acid transport system II carrier protein [Peptostreptococcus porci]MDY5479575.1 branched-chain amino acid transport system II carrier protein [Peptostreptococcus porci]MDY6230821.1 branched-chain amino acid transport system II carrier protein [Peptostreptococcus porci]MST61929.1 branched-chain amino acid transport system II carrier protein [Peptostreptococcus porci]